jgi:hypothetical protein
MEVLVVREHVERVYDVILESLDHSAEPGLLNFHELAGSLFRDGATRVAQRPLPWLSLPILTCEALGGDLEAAYYVAAAWEVGFRAAGYLDEWQDQDTDDALWRSIGAKDTVNLVIGLVIFSQSVLSRLQELEDVPASTIVKLSSEFSETVLTMAAGQYADLSGDLSLEDYETVAAAKTGAQWQLATRAGALIAGADPEVTARYGDFGLALGMLFQGWNDLYGLSGADGKRDREHGRSLPMLAALRMRQDQMLDRSQELVGGQLYAIVQIEMLHQRAAGALDRCPERGRLALFLDKLAVQEVLDDVA